MTKNGIVVGENDSPSVIMKLIKDRVNAINLDLNDWEYDRCHRLSHKYNKYGKTFQRVIFKMCSWRCRNEICANRKRLPFIISADLTDSRQKTFEFPKLEKDKSSAQRVMQFVFVDENYK